ncbi:hypothetical protein PF005_g15809 [Phytophthora fragariae]|uniref:Uncharacterized protein n=1 Tax=Phytophthora fragariae TaxID=53985 RepID=A0A6A3TEK5_9STRA|nr:hypothetical protein PF003_g11019 [Phytophthora fragariae]KAE9075083.1 hypothetical protein PF010_g24445 [Phytophthora fragariae]KAE9134827.1 hypothetical protein PF006_g14739 [Phytophthora fragariae]KAE9183747.1 hypothetical protein PF004_g23855 [Phytophthora fragariae]KAE9199252.1 hypothetical protein PF005_g15809 [Phytophthora fragariae]
MACYGSAVATPPTAATHNGQMDGRGQRPESAAGVGGMAPSPPTTEERQQQAQATASRAAWQQLALS